MGISIATKAFFKLLFNRELSHQFQQLLDNPNGLRITDSKVADPKATSPASTTATATDPIKPAKPSANLPRRSEAIELLAALQRESRLLDIVNEPLEQYSDAQVGAAARDVLSKAGGVIDRMFGLEPLTDTEDGKPLTTPANFDPARFRLTGNVTGEPPFAGIVAHHGWRITRCEIPQWTGKSDSQQIVAPIELEVK